MPSRWCAPRRCRCSSCAPETRSGRAAAEVRREPRERALIGLERERNPAAKAGVRTFALVALLGTLAASAGDPDVDRAGGPRRGGRHADRRLFTRAGARGSGHHHRGGGARVLPARRACRRGRAGARRSPRHRRNRASLLQARDRGNLDRAQAPRAGVDPPVPGRHVHRAADPARPRLRAVRGAQSAQYLADGGARLGHRACELRGIARSGLAATAC